MCGSNCRWRRPRHEEENEEKEGNAEEKGRLTHPYSLVHVQGPSLIVITGNLDAALLSPPGFFRADIFLSGL